MGCPCAVRPTRGVVDTSPPRRPNCCAPPPPAGLESEAVVATCAHVASGRVSQRRLHEPPGCTGHATARQAQPGHGRCGPEGVEKVGSVEGRYGCYLASRAASPQTQSMDPPKLHCETKTQASPPTTTRPTLLSIKRIPSFPSPLFSPPSPVPPFPPPPLISCPHSPPSCNMRSSSPASPSPACVACVA
eukprot:360184-Chlamydomonas_euryale.AAC.5